MISKIVNLQKIFYNSHIYNVYVMFYYEISWFHQDFYRKNVFFPSGHGSISDASMRRLIEGLRDISKRADLQSLKRLTRD